MSDPDAELETSFDGSQWRRMLLHGEPGESLSVILGEELTTPDGLTTAHNDPETLFYLAQDTDTVELSAEAWARVVSELAFRIPAVNQRMREDFRQ